MLALSWHVVLFDFFWFVMFFSWYFCWNCSLAWGYQQGDYFKPHTDGSWNGSRITSKGKHRHCYSLLTLPWRKSEEKSLLVACNSGVLGLLFIFSSCPVLIFRFIDESESGFQSDAYGDRHSQLTFLILLTDAWQQKILWAVPLGAPVFVQFTSIISACWSWIYRAGTKDDYEGGCTRFLVEPWPQSRP